MFYRETQYGWLVILPCTLLVAFLLFLILSRGGNDDIPWKVSMPVLLVMVSVVILFYKFEVEVNSEEICFSYGIGWIKKSLAMEDIASVEAVRNKWYYGLGIRILPGGMLYNIHGLEAAQVRLRHTSRWVRIGAESGERLARAIENALSEGGSEIE